MSQQVLHLDFVTLSPSTGPESREHLIEAASGLTAIDRVLGAGVIERAGVGDFDLAFYFVLADFAALEPFGTDSRYSHFLQGEVAPKLQSFAGADVLLDGDFPPSAEFGAVLALIAPDETYDWEVRDALQAWAAKTGAATRVWGLAVGERQQYRGLALVFGPEISDAAPPEPARFRATMLRGTARALA